MDIDLAEIYADEHGEVITQAPICEAINIQWVCQLPFVLQLLLVTVSSWTAWNTTWARADVFQALCTGQCALLPAFDTIGTVEQLFYDNYEAGTHKRVLYDTMIPSEDKYVYTLFFDKSLHLRTGSGALCEGGKTTVTTTLHPCIAAVLASRFDFCSHPEHVFALVMQDHIEPFMERPIWESFFDPPHYFGRPVECIAEDRCSDEEAARKDNAEVALLTKRINEMISLRS
ncbi:hypothetical protein BDZ89DRAFT_1071899 [Hymenopellis radicata]|nr:hypothetical protein BDZ89DRAFT_1071899 [Hymenopellis radicata]